MKTIGYFGDAMVAFVQTPKEAIAPKTDPFGVRDRIFYDSLQPGRAGAGAAFSCGSGVIWRVSALEAIGGFVTWNLCGRFNHLLLFTHRRLPLGIS